MAIAEPLNDHECLGQLTRLAVDAVDRDDVKSIASSFVDVEDLAAWIRSLPQTHDAGDEREQPRVDCDVSQRARVVADDPNCVERSLLYLVAAEHIDPRPVRQLATRDTPHGRHTFPAEDGRPVVLDPRQRRNALRASLYLLQRRNSPPPTIRTRDALRWLIELAEDEATSEGDHAAIEEAEDALPLLATGRPLSARQRAALRRTLQLGEDAAHLFGEDGAHAARLASDHIERACDACRRAEALATRPAPQPRNARLGFASLAAFRPVAKRVSQRVNWERVGYWGGLGAATYFGGPAGATTYHTAYGQIVKPPARPSAASGSAPSSTSAKPLPTLEAFATTKKG